MNRLRIAFTTIAALGLVTLALGGDRTPPWNNDLVIAVVTKITGGGSMYEDPPRVTLEIREVFQGDGKLDRSNAIWTPPWHGIDYGGTGTRELKEYKIWAATKLEPPAVGSRWIVFGRNVTTPAGEVFYVDDRDRSPDSPEARKQILEMLDKVKVWHEKQSHPATAPTTQSLPGKLPQKQ